AACTASSSRSPFASACASTRRDAGTSWVLREPIRTVTRDAETSSTVPCSHVPFPSPSVMVSPTLTRRTTDACLASVPVREMRSPIAASVQSGTMKCRAMSAPIGVRRSVAAEAIAQFREQALLELGQSGLRRPGLLRELFDQLALRGIQPSRSQNLHAYAEVAALAAAQRRDPTAADRQHVTGLHSRAHFEIDRAVQALDGRRGAEDRIRHGHLEGGQQVVALPAEHRIRGAGDLDVEVSVRTARPAHGSGP